MKLKDLLNQSEGVHMALVPELNEENHKEWWLHIVNNKEESITSLFLTSKGSGMNDGKMVQTSTLRRKLPDLQGQTAVKVELLPEDLLHLSNEFRLSYYVNNEIFDKICIFLPEAIRDENIVDIPVVNQKGILIE